MAVELGGDKAWKQKIFGDVVVSFQWVNEEPAMVLFAKTPKIKRGAYCICLSSAFKYVKSDGYPEEYLIKQSVVAADIMGFEQSSFVCRQIADAILESIEDLVAMPPEPTGMNEKQSRVIGEAIIKVNGETVTEKEVTEGNRDMFVRASNG
jgi:hypothetical protein